MRPKPIQFILIAIVFSSFLTIFVFAGPTIVPSSVNCNDLGRFDITTACNCALGTTPSAASCPESLQGICGPESIAGDVRGACGFITGRNVNAWTGQFLTRTMEVVGIKDDFYAVLTAMANNDFENVNVDVDFRSKLEEVMRQFEQFLADTKAGWEALANSVCKNVATEWKLHCWSQESADPTCGYIQYSDGTYGPRINGQDSCNHIYDYEITNIDCHALDPVLYKEDCIGQKNYVCRDNNRLPDAINTINHCLRVESEIGTNPCNQCYNPGYGEGECHIEYRETADCKKMNGLWMDAGNQMIVAEENMGCASYESIQIGGSNIRPVKDPKPGVGCTKTNYADPKELPWCPKMSNEKCGNTCYDTDGDLCCPEVIEEGDSFLFTGRSNWRTTLEGQGKSLAGCNSCGQTINICHQLCELESETICSPTEPASSPGGCTPSGFGCDILPGLPWCTCG